MFELLLVDDNPADVRLTKEALKETNLKSHINHAQDGIEALEFLRKEGKYKDVLTPDLILLDLNLPRKNGNEVLEEIKSDENLKNIPVIVLSTSSSEQDIANVYNLNANCFITKPIDLEEYISTIKSVLRYWYKQKTV